MKKLALLSIPILTSTLFFTSYSVLATPAQASVYIPSQQELQPDVSVYLSPELAVAPNKPDLSRLEDKVRSLPNLNLQVFVVADLVDQPNQEKVRAYAAEVATKIQQDPRFDRTKDTLILYWGINSQNPTKGSVAANPNASLRSKGVSAEWLSNPDKGIPAALKQYMPQDPTGAFVSISEKVNDQVRLNQFQSNLPGYLMIFLGLCGMSFSAFTFIKRQQVKASECSELISEWREQIQISTRNCLALDTYSQYLNPTYVSPDKDKQAYLDQALKDYNLLTGYLSKAIELVREAEARPSQAIQILSNRAIKVDRLAQPSDSLYQADYETLNAGELKRQMNRLYQEVKKSMSLFLNTAPPNQIVNSTRISSRATNPFSSASAAKPKPYTSKSESKPKKTESKPASKPNYSSNNVTGTYYSSPVHESSSSSYTSESSSSYDYGSSSSSSSYDSGSSSSSYDSGSSSSDYSSGSGGGDY